MATLGLPLRVLEAADLSRWSEPAAGGRNAAVAAHLCRRRRQRASAPFILGAWSSGPFRKETCLSRSAPSLFGRQRSTAPKVNA